jgi:HSP20 family protein
LLPRIPGGIIRAEVVAEAVAERRQKMALVRLRRDPWNALESMYDDLSRVLTTAPVRSTSIPWRMGFRGVPSIDMWEDEENVYLEADIPGMDPDDINVEVQDGALTISAEREETSEEDERDYYRSERYSGSYYREMALPSSVDSEKIKATSRNGVLTVTLPKKPKEIKKGKRVEVTSG